MESIVAILVMLVLIFVGATVFAGLRYFLRTLELAESNEFRVTAARDLLPHFRVPELFQLAAKERIETGVDGEQQRELSRKLVFIVKLAGSRERVWEQLQNYKEAAEAAYNGLEVKFDGYGRPTFVLEPTRYMLFGANGDPLDAVQQEAMSKAELYKAVTEASDVQNVSVWFPGGEAFNGNLDLFKSKFG